MVPSDRPYAGLVERRHRYSSEPGAQRASSRRAGPPSAPASDRAGSRTGLAGPGSDDAFPPPCSPMTNQQPLPILNDARFGIERAVVPLADIEPAPWGPRLFRPDAGAREWLKQSIEDGGLIHPITVRPIPGPSVTGRQRYECIAGQRRLGALVALADAGRFDARIAEEEATDDDLIAALTALLKADYAVRRSPSTAPGRFGSWRMTVAVPVVIVQVGELSARMAAFEENRQREALTVYENARYACELLMLLRTSNALAGLSLTQYAKLLRVPVSTLSGWEKIGTRITPNLLIAAGFGDRLTRELDGEKIRQLRWETLLHAAADPEDLPFAERLTRLERAAGGDLSVDSQAEIPCRAVLPRHSPSGRGIREVPRSLIEVTPDWSEWERERLRHHGGIRYKVTKPFATYPAEEAAYWLQRIAPAVTVLSEVAAPQEPLQVHTVGSAQLLVLSKSPAALSADEAERALKALDRVRQTLLERTAPPQTPALDAAQ